MRKVQVVMVTKNKKRKEEKSGSMALMVLIKQQLTVVDFEYLFLLKSGENLGALIII